MNSNVAVQPNNSLLIWQDMYMKGDDLQKISVLQSLPSLLQTDNNGTVNRILPKIQQELPTSSSEFHLVASRIFRNLIQMNLNLNLLKPVLQGIESKDPLVSNAWIDTLLSVILNLNDAAIKREVLPFAVSMSQLNKSAAYRIASCKILGQIAIHPRLSAFDVKKDILPVVQSLCQDCFHEVRTSMCYELANIAKGLGGDNLVKSSLLPSLVELSSDENVSVRAASVDAAVLMIPYLNQDTIKQTILPLIKQLCGQSAKQSNVTFSVMAKVYGMLLYNLQNHVTPAEGQWFLTFFLQLAKKGINTPVDLDMDPGLDVTCREQCAYNLPAVTSFMVNKVPGEMNTWYQIFKTLVSDPCYLVRKTVAAGIHEVAKILGNESKTIMMDFVKLLRDDSEEVLDSLVPNIGTTLEVLCIAGVLSRENVAPGTLEVSRALLKCQTDIFRCHNWRRKMTLLQQLECLPNVIESDFIHQHFTSVILKLTISARARPVRSQATRTILVFLRYNLKENHRKWIREKLTSLLFNSPCCYTRHIFVNMCIHALDIFSTKYFKEYFFLPLVKLIEDPVSTIRLCVVRISPMLKRMCLSAVDRNYQVKLENALAKIEVVETDKDVIMCLKSKLKEMRVPQVTRPEALMEEKRRVEEEDKVQQGKLPPPKFSSLAPRAKEVPSGAKPLATSKSATITTKKVAPASSTTTSDMSFLGHHFYIDAGVALPHQKIGAEDFAAVEDKLRTLEMSVTRERESHARTVSLENTNVENMSDDDLKQLETSTTNITDDVKANIQKKSQFGGLAKCRAQTEAVKRRSKRYSCVFPSEQPPTTNNVILKRRSLNIGPSETSKIPISCKYMRKPEEGTNLRRSKSISISGCYGTPSKGSVFDKRGDVSRLRIPANAENRRDSRVRSSETLALEGGLEVDGDGGCMADRRDTLDRTEVKENVPMEGVGNGVTAANRFIKDNGTKASNLPVLVRRTQSEVRK